jgi:hypothetical protein
MKAKNPLLVLSTFILLASCGQNSTKTETETDSLNATTQTDGIYDTSATTNNSNNVTGNVSVSVPEPIQAKFREKYPSVRDVTWSKYAAYDGLDWDWTGWPIMDTADFLARFNYNGADYWAWYDNDNSNWVGSVSRLNDFKSLPSAVTKVINSNYAGYTIDAVDQEFDKKRTAYEIDLSKGSDRMTILVDENGNIMKKKTVTDGQKTKEKNI